MRKAKLTLSVDPIIIERAKKQLKGKVCLYQK